MDEIFRQFFVTPDMHRVHHSVYEEETNSNYGFNISLWDQMFGTYIAQPKDGHDDMRIGLDEFRDDKKLGLISLILQPFKK